MNHIVHTFGRIQIKQYELDNYDVQSFREEGFKRFSYGLWTVDSYSESKVKQGFSGGRRSVDYGRIQTQRTNPNLRIMNEISLDFTLSDN